MEAQQDHIARWIEEIDEQVGELEAEKRMLIKLRGLLRGNLGVIKGSDVFSLKAAAKFEILARVAEYLYRPDPLLYGGATTKELFEVLCESAESSSSGGAKPARGRRGSRDEGAEASFLRLALTGKKVRYGTFRSILTRLRMDGRLYFDRETKRWRVTEEKIVVERPEGRDPDDEKT
ncbi:hypothetical protein [Litorisediminicola beolgyonensis]|uniref:Uncharacterized protein n=1 Tax=Litorisediminicola beolgyonensis TaxID=1173614 RepID=A0ABW3ZGX0_9RHOB